MTGEFDPLDVKKVSESQICAQSVLSSNERHTYGLESSYFEKEGDELMIDLGTVFLALDNSENQFSQPPEHYDLVKLLQKQRVPEEKNQFCIERKAAIQKVLSNRLHQLKVVSKILWLRIFQIMGDYLASNHEEIVTIWKHLTDMTLNFTMMFLGQWSITKNCAPYLMFESSPRPIYLLALISAWIHLSFLSITLLVKLPLRIVHNHVVSMYQTCHPKDLQN